MESHAWVFGESFKRALWGLKGRARAMLSYIEVAFLGVRPGVQPSKPEAVAKGPSKKTVFYRGPPFRFRVLLTYSVWLRSRFTKDVPVFRNHQTMLSPQKSASTIHFKTQILITELLGAFGTGRQPSCHRAVEGAFSQALPLQHQVLTKVWCSCNTNTVGVHVALWHSPPPTPPLKRICFRKS